MFTPKEKEIAQFGIDNGKTNAEIKIALNKYRAESQPTVVIPTIADKGYGERVAETAGQEVSGIGESLGRAKELISQGDILGGLTRGALGTVAGGIRAGFSPITEAVAPIVAPIIKPIISTAMKVEPVQDVVSIFKTLAEQHPDAAKNVIDALEIATLGQAGPVVSGVIKKPIMQVARGSLNLAEQTARGVARIPSAAVGVIKSAPEVIGAGYKGSKQVVTELAERIPRAATRVKEGSAEAAIRAEKISQATPSIQKALKAEVGEQFIDVAKVADLDTLKAYKEVIDIADETPAIGMKRQPTMVGGEAAVKQYDVIMTKQRAIGSQLGDAIKALPRDTKVDMAGALSTLDDILAMNEIYASTDDVGKIILDTSRSNLTPTQASAVEELYNLAVRGADNVGQMDTKLIHTKDQLFSKLGRTAKFDKSIGDVRVDTPDGSQSLFSVFRDVYSKTMDTTSPEIKVLNSQYRTINNLTDDIEDSILKTPNFNVTETVDPAEFAKVNMRRIFGEAQSSPAYEAVANAMDKMSRQLGYKGVTPKVAVEFAIALRELYPATIPRAGFAGGIKLGIGDIAEKITTIGKLNVKDQQKALRDLVSDLIAEKGTKVKLPTNKKKVNLTNQEVTVPTSKAKANQPLAPEAQKKLFTTPEKTKARGIQLITKTFGDKEAAISHAEQYWAKEGKEGIFHHATKEQSPFGGFEKEKAVNMDIGLRRGVSNVNGLYVGRDAKALHEFYNMAAERGENIITYKGNPKLLDLTDEDVMMKFTDKFKTGDQIEKELSKNGYDGIKYFDPYSTGEEIVITNKNVLEAVAFNGKSIKTRSQLSAQYDEVVKGKAKVNPLASVKTKPAISTQEAVAKGISKEEWIKEARKYKTAEEFMKAQPTFYRGEGGADVAQGKALMAEGRHFAMDSEYPKRFGDVKEYVAKPDAKVFDASGMDYPEIRAKLGLPDTGKFSYISQSEYTKALKANGYDILKYDGTYQSTGKPFVHTVEITPNSLITKSQLTDIWNKANKKVTLPKNGRNTK